MFGVSGGELIILLVIGLVVLGPERLPRVANQIGGWLGQARRMTRVMKRQLEEELDLNETLNINPPASSREPSTQAATSPQKSASSDETIAKDSAQAEHTLPRDDDDYSPAHDADELGTGVTSADDHAASAAESDAATDLSSGGAHDVSVDNGAATKSP